ncbi:MAG: hypothetical protein GQ574_14635 [Crocinitomix sp.]|nr:hypothetical protein [Crocinitomix sp.]
MAQQKLPVEINSFGGGLITEINPLNFPPNASADEKNMRLNRDGSRNRRLGFDLENNAVTIDSSISFNPADTLGASQYKWKNAGGDVDKELIVLQVGGHMSIYDLDNAPVSGTVLYTEDFGSTAYAKDFSYAVVDSYLVAATGLGDIAIYDYSSGAVVKTTDRLLIRDLFGLEAVVDGDDLTLTSNMQTRPTTLEDEHLYNLRNQAWALPRLKSNTEVKDDPITHFFAQEATYPANSDNLLRALLADSSDSDNRTIERFFAENLIDSPTGSSYSPKGHFIIDAMNRGSSRLTQEGMLVARNIELDFSLTSLGSDVTPGGASVLEEYAGRVWYSGFSGEVTEGDSKSPRMSSFVMFSRLVKDKTDITQCYQEADPTSEIESDIVATDGGFIRINGAYGIKKLVNVANSLFVFALNGVWRISGEDQSGFTATAYRVDRISQEGCSSGDSVAFVEDSMFYWANSGIYRVGANEYGDWTSVNIAQPLIQTFYNEIPVEQKKQVAGAFDSYEQKIRWIYGGPLNVSGPSKELVFDTLLQAFSVNDVAVTSGTDHRIVGIFEGQPYKTTERTLDVTEDGTVVTASGVDVTVTSLVRADSTKELLYMVVTTLNGSIKYSIGAFTDNTFVDWGGITSTNYESYLVTGFLTAQESRRRKQVPYITTYLKKTEDGFSGDYVPDSQSSCMVSTRWDWTNSANSNKWSTPFEAYRHKRNYMPTSLADTFDDGNSMVVTKNKVRGRGRSVAMKFASSQGKDMYIYGWSEDLTINAED